MYANHFTFQHATIEIRLYRKGAFILADIHGMDHFCTKLAPPPYNKPRCCVSRIHTPMVMVWLGNVQIFNKVELYICYLRKNPQKSLGAAPTFELSMARTSANYIGPFSINSLISMHATVIMLS
jgi:hypothetical protein